MTSSQCQLWMGSLEPYMTETFILNAFRKIGEKPLSVKIMRNKVTGEAAGYCFVNFSSDTEALDVMHKLNGKPIPGTNPSVRFRLNNAANSLVEKDYSVWVGDLTAEVDDYALYRTFSNKYASVKTAKIIVDNSSFSKGYGFVRFGNEDEQRDAMINMNGYVGLGSKPLKICNAVLRSKMGASFSNTALSTPATNALLAAAAAAAASQDYSQYYDAAPQQQQQYWQNYASSWQSYYDPHMNMAAAAAAAAAAAQNAAYDQQSHDYYANASHMNNGPGHAGLLNSNNGHSQASTVNTNNLQVIRSSTDTELVEHKEVLNLDELNNETVEQDSNFWDSLESSKWLPFEILELPLTTN